jgi:serine phosphatase RsbU (regulator of sigma subunit)
LFSDGYADQFGGPDHKKFKYSSLKSLLLEIHLQTMDEQRERLEKEFLNWKGSGTQTDDVMIIGLKL